MTALAHRHSLLFFAMAVSTMGATLDLHAQETRATVGETPQTEAGVMAVDAHWTVAELTGDTGWLDRMLLPDYRSVNNDGTVHTKSAILASAAKHTGTSVATATQHFADYQKQYPSATAVTMQGDTAIITFYDPALGPQKGIRSSDVLIYLNGGWHAMYSQHTARSG